MYTQRQRELLLAGSAALDRTSESLLRSERAALESETVGASVVAELGQQREVLQRTSNRLGEIDSSLSRTHRVLNILKLRFFTNKLLLILIIILEIGILCAVVYLKFLR